MDKMRYYGEPAKKRDPKTMEVIGYDVKYEYYDTEKHRNNWEPKWLEKIKFFETEKEAKEFNSKLEWEKVNLNNEHRSKKWRMENVKRNNKFNSNT